MHKMEREMEEVFEMKVQEKLQKLKDIEADVSRLLPESISVHELISYSQQVNNDVVIDPLSIHGHGQVPW